MYPVGKKVRLEIQKAPGAVKPRANQDKASEVSGPELLNSLLKKHTLYQVDDKAIIKAVHVGGGRQAAQLLCDITSITKTSATVNSPVFGKVKFALTPAGVKKLMGAVSDATGGRYGAFKSESSAGSEKAKNMGLISAGFGRYRSKEGGPITHKVVGGKLSVYKGGSASSKVKPAPKGAASKLYVADDLDFAGSDTLADVKAYVAKYGLKVINGVEDGINGMPTADVVGTKKNIGKFLVDYNGLDLTDDQLEEVIKPYKNSVGGSSKKDESSKKDKKRLAELEGEIKDLRKQLLREYQDDLDDEDDYDEYDADDYVSDDDDMRELLSEKYRLEKRLKKK
jgi:hypothetical protein